MKLMIFLIRKQECSFNVLDLCGLLKEIKTLNMSIIEPPKDTGKRKLKELETPWDSGVLCQER